MIMDIEAIREHLPHRYPFLLVDRVVNLELGKRIEAYKNLSINEPFFDGHFPDNPVFPGVLLVEAMAQAAGILGFKSMGKTPADGSIYYLVGSIICASSVLVSPATGCTCTPRSRVSVAGFGSSRCEPKWMVSFALRLPSSVRTVKE